jgi:signal transduction histidine kinase
MTIPITRPTILRDLATSVSDSTDRIALIDAFGNIVATNEAWIAFAEESGSGPNHIGPGTNYFELCRDFYGHRAREARGGIRAVLQGKLHSFTMDYTDHTLSELGYVRMTASPMCYGDARVVVSHTDITELQVSKERSLERLHHFAQRLVNAQEEERQRIAREIHDDLGNRIALLAFSIRRVMNTPRVTSASDRNEVGRVIDGITDLSNALRNLAHCLHPPLLKYSGICAALKTLCQEFGRTQGINIEVVVPSETPALPDDVGLCIFRISQECLQNIAKHSGAQTASVVLERTAKQIRLKVSDTGRGFDEFEATQKGGLGLLSIEERAMCIRGRLEVNSAPGAGTEICVTIPLPVTRDRSLGHTIN